MQARTTSKTVAFIGAGAMGGAIARGLVREGTLAPERLLIADTNATIREEFEALGARSFKDAATMLEEKPGVVVVAVKPQVLKAVLEPLVSRLSDSLVVSIAAGVKLATLQEILGNVAVIRAMPNLPVSVSSGAIALAKGECATQDELDELRDLLSSVAEVRVMREDQLDVAGVVSGSAPAFFALIVDILARAGITHGMTNDDARAMVAATMQGTAASLLSEGVHARAYMDKVTSPGGTTAAALAVMEPALEEALWAGVEAAMERTRELGK